MPRKHVPEPAAWPTVGPAGPSRGAGAWRQGQDTHARPIGGRRGACGAGPRCRWVAAGPGRASRRRARPHPSDQAPPVWRAPEGPEGTGGLRGAAPNEVRTPSLAGGRALRRPKHQRRHKHHKQEGRRGACGAWPRCRWVAAGPGRASRRRARPHPSDQAPPVWRAPEGPEGTGGLRDRPLRAAGSRVAISRAAGASGAWNTSGATSNAGDLAGPQPQQAAPRAAAAQ